MSNNKYVPYFILIPVLFAIFAVTGCGFFYRAAVSASCVVILCLFPAKEISSSIRWVIAALIISIGGDWFMSHVNGLPVRFIYGICLFFAAHVGFLCFCLINGHIRWQVLLPVLTCYQVFFFVMLRPASMQPALLIAVVMYLLVSCFSLAAATGLRLPAIRQRFSAGIALLVFSDTIIALKVFAGCTGLGFLILPSYFASHILITWSLMRRR